MFLHTRRAHFFSFDFSFNQKNFFDARLWKKNQLLDDKETIRCAKMSSLARAERNDGVNNLPRGQQQPSSQGRTYVSVVQNLGPPQQTPTKNGINGMRADALSTPNAPRSNTITSPLINNGSSSAEDRNKGKQIGGRVEGATNYDKETVLTLLKLMPEAGYLNRKRLKMSVKDVFAEAVNMAESRHGIKRSAQGWRRKFHRIRMGKSSFSSQV